MILDQARHSVEVTANPRLQWLQQRMLMLISKMDFNCLAAISHADDAASRGLHLLSAQLRDARVGRMPIVPQLLEACTTVLLPAMAASPSFRVRVMTSTTKKNLAKLCQMRQELLSDVSSTLQMGTQKLLHGCHEMINSGLSMEAVSAAVKALSEASDTGVVTQRTISTCRSCFQDLVSRHVTNSKEMLQEVSHQEMLLKISGRYNPDDSNLFVPGGKRVTGDAQPGVVPQSFVQQTASRSFAGADSSESMLEQLANNGVRQHVPKMLTGLPSQGNVPNATFESLGHPHLSHPAEPMAATARKAPYLAPGVASTDRHASPGAQSEHGQAGEELVRGLLQKLTMHPPKKSMPAGPQSNVQQPHLVSSVAHHKLQPVQPVHVSGQPIDVSSRHRSTSVHQDTAHQTIPRPSEGHDDPLEIWRLLRDTAK